MDSIVPYRGDNSSVVLRHENSLVVYDHNSRQLALRSTTPPTPHDAPTLRSPSCPYCHQSISEELAEGIRRDSAAAAAAAAAAANAHRRDHHASSGATSPEDTGFITPEYFRILNARLLPDGSTHLSPPGSPRRRMPSLVGSSTTPATTAHVATVTSTSGSPVDEHNRSDSRGRYARSRSSSTHGISSSAFSPGYFNQFFVKERELGKGGKGVVLLVRHVLDGVNLGLFACKRVPVGDDHTWLAKVLMEVQLLQQLSHQNLVSYRHAWLEDMQISNFGPSVPCAFILQQYCNAGDLQNYVYEKKATQTNDQIKDQLRMRRLSKSQKSRETSAGPKLLPFEQVISFFRDIASGLNYLHSNGFIHRDLKPSNCLLHDTGVPGSELRVLVSDFGEVQREDAKRRSTGATGTISYYSPVLNDCMSLTSFFFFFVAKNPVGPSGEFGNFTTKSDIFSLGMILHFMCFAKLPYLNSDEANEENEEIDKLREEISAWAGYNDRYRNARGDIPEKLLRNLGRLLSVEPAKRPSASDILGGIRSEFGYGEDGISRRTPVSPKPPNLGLADDGRFHRISPVPSGPSTPVINPSTSLARSNKPRNGPLSGKQHTRKSSKLREITSQLNLPESLTSSSLMTPANGSIESLDSNTSAVSASQATIDSGTSSSPSSDEEGPLVPVRTQSSSLILRPKGHGIHPSAQSPRENKYNISDGMSSRQDDDDIKSIVITTDSKPPALTAPPTPAKSSFARRLVVMPQVWLVVKILLFFLKVISMMNRCSPVAPNPWVFNSLLLLALVDLFGPFLATTILLLVLHAAGFYVAFRFSALCATDDGSRHGIWEWTA
ncbi:hypothetical protein H072_2142 [Dactylellina haptotyla CBS 200.50]|uniref:non-specific serine/threonine protein kinase n=1 Tax=Dactylellina haptotyla (strain CBS 200.50) TaxID=1284197 RepID=S8ASJ9_DACHA|nr:hypothetical protein H072_2142 [Dactylellina haptotyla CBS 200.50]